jgi:hypothetical protein
MWKSLLTAIIESPTGYRVCIRSSFGRGQKLSIDAVARVSEGDLNLEAAVAHFLIDHRSIHHGSEEKELLTFPISNLEKPTHMHYLASRRSSSSKSDLPH